MVRSAQGRVLRNVATMVDAPSKAKHEVQPLSEEEVQRFLESVKGDRLEALYTVALATGLRQGELPGLRWSDIDLEDGTLTVRHTMSRIGAGLGDPKTAASRRTVRLPESATILLRHLRASQRVVRLGDDYVFASKNGAALQARNVTRTSTGPFIVPVWSEDASMINGARSPRCSRAGACMLPW